MKNTLHIHRVAVRYFKGDPVRFGFLLTDDFESDAVLPYLDEAAVPSSIRGLVEICREAYCVNAVDLLERCAEEGYLAHFDGKRVDRAELAAALAETRDASEVEQPVPTGVMSRRLRCPECRQDDAFAVEAWQCLTLYGDGTFTVGDEGQQWDGDSPCRCEDCDHEGIVSDFVAGDIRPSRIARPPEP